MRGYNHRGLIGRGLFHFHVSAKLGEGDILVAWKFADSRWLLHWDIWSSNLAPAAAGESPAKGQIDSLIASAPGPNPTVQ